MTLRLGIVDGFSFLGPTAIMCDSGGCQGKQYAQILGNDNPEGEVKTQAHHRRVRKIPWSSSRMGCGYVIPSPGEAVVKSKGLLATICTYMLHQILRLY